MASRATIWRANQLRYTHHINRNRAIPNVPEGIRTPDPRLRRPLLYPAELRTHASRNNQANELYFNVLSSVCQHFYIFVHKFFFRFFFYLLPMPCHEEKCAILCLIICGEKRYNGQQTDKERRCICRKKKMRKTKWASCP